jgi:hypothetical protein
VRKGNILIPKGQKERKSVTFAIRLRTIIWYDREGVKFRDSGSEIERNIAKRQICHTLPERSLQAGLSKQKKALRSKTALPGAKKRSREQNKVLPGAPELSTFAERVIFSY